MVLSDEKLWDLWNAQGTDDMSKAEAFTFARAIEAEVRKQDDALIQQMHVALKNCRATGALDDQAHALASTAITAGRARLGEKT